MQLMPRAAALRLFALSAFMLLVQGCATERIVLNDGGSSGTRLFVTRAGDEVTLAWDSLRGHYYAIYFNRTRNGKTSWNILPGFERIAGTGMRLTFSDRVPAGEPRYYRLHTYAADGTATSR